jgi:hypothetical protein
MDHILIANSEAYEGKYVTTCDDDSIKVVSSSDSPAEAYKEAKEKGCDDPVLIYVPIKKEALIL